MAVQARSPGATAAPRTLVWVDAAEAIIVRWDGTAVIEWLVSEVPSHRRSSGHVGHDPALRAMGSPPSDRHRLEHLRQHLRLVADRIVPTDEVEVIGPANVREHLVAIIAAEDRLHGRRRRVGTARASRRSLPQLVARVRASAGASARRVQQRDPGDA